MSDRDVTFRMKLEDDPSSREVAQDLKKRIQEVDDQLEKAKKQSTDFGIKTAEGFRTAAEGSLRLARGIAFLVASGDRDLERFAKQIAKIQGIIDIGTGTLDTLKGVIQAYETWASKAKAVAAANELVAASNAKVAASGAAAAGGGGLLGRFGATALGAGVGGYAGYRYAQSQGYGPLGTLGFGIAGSAGGGAVVEGARWGLGRLAGGIAGAGGLSGIGGGIGSAARATGPLGLAIAAGTYIGNIGSRWINQETTGENAGTVDIAGQAFSRWRENRRVGSSLNEQIDYRNSAGGIQKFLVEAQRRDQLQQSLQDAEFQSRSALSRNFSSRNPLLEQLDLQKERLVGIQDERRSLEGSVNANHPQREQLRLQQRIADLKKQEAQINQQILQSQESIFQLSKATKEETQQRLQSEKQARSSQLQEFGQLSRQEQNRTARAYRRFEAGDTRESTLQILQRSGIATERIRKIREQAGASAASRLGLTDALVGDEDKRIATLERQLENNQESVDREGKRLVDAVSGFQKVYVESQKRAAELFEGLQALAESDNQLRGAGRK